MPSYTTLTTVRSAATEAIISNTSNSNPPTAPEPAAEILETDPSNMPAVKAHSASFRKDILRRYETPFETSWIHGGLND